MAAVRSGLSNYELPSSTHLRDNTKEEFKFKHAMSYEEEPKSKKYARRLHDALSRFKTYVATERKPQTANRKPILLSTGLGHTAEESRVASPVMVMNEVAFEENVRMGFCACFTT
jgi:hypothetical protein